MFNEVGNCTMIQLMHEVHNAKALTVLVLYKIHRQNVLCQDLCHSLWFGLKIAVC